MNENINYWLVGSIWDNIDKADDFVRDGVWINGFNEKYFDNVKSIKIGDIIAIKSSYTKSKNLPFDNQNKVVSVMKIKAIGQVVENMNDGKNIKVNWDKDFEQKEIYGFTYRNTISKIDKSKWQIPIAWIFEGKEQDDFFSFSDPVKQLIEAYKIRISENKLKDESYKWQLISEYQGRPNINTEDFENEIKSIKFKNLIYHNGIAVIHHLVKEKSEEIRELFRELFDEDKNLEDRVIKFNNASLALYRSLGETLQHHQDERTIATYLTFYNSDKYTLYKKSFYKKYCQLLGVSEASKNKKYVHYLGLIEELIENYIKEDSELIRLVKKLIPEYYDGINHNVLAQDILYQMLDQSPSEKEEKNGEKDMLDNNIKHPLNQILYGPPGTGKTYNTINKAIEIIDNKFYLENKDKENARDLFKDEFKKYKSQGQIEFVTFHQSYGYEEFVEGIKADLESKEIKYKLEEGIFKKLSNKAKTNFEDSKKSRQELEEQKTTKQKIEQFLNDSLESQSEFAKTKGGKFKIKDLSESTIFIYTEDSNYSENVIDLDIEEFTKIINSNIEIKTSRQLAKDIFNINNQRQKDTYYFAMWKQFKEITFDIQEEIVNEQLKNYILLIDEINRGNISKIFGELITLIEPSKRIGADEDIRVKLPYSNYEFGVPSNLYIIGTMNTADRSIAQIDTALRRRFVFKEMMPKPELLVHEDNSKLNIIDEEDKNTNIDVVEILTAINERIEYIYDREHTIGHSYFMPLIKTPTIEKLEEIFRVNIIPLLAEYFYGDWEDIKFVLNNNFIEEKPQSEYVKNSNSSRTLNKVYNINEKFEISQYIEIYDSNSDKDQNTPKQS